MQRVQKSLHVLNLPSMLLMTEERWALAIMHSRSHASSSLSALPACARARSARRTLLYDVVKPAGIMDSRDHKLWPGGARPAVLPVPVSTRMSITL